MRQQEGQLWGHRQCKRGRWGRGLIAGLHTPRLRRHTQHQPLLLRLQLLRLRLRLLVYYSPPHSNTTTFSHQQSSLNCVQEAYPTDMEHYWLPVWATPVSVSTVCCSRDMCCPVSVYVSAPVASGPSCVAESKTFGSVSAGGNTDRSLGAAAGVGALERLPPLFDCCRCCLTKTAAEWCCRVLGPPLPLRSKAPR